MRKLLPVASLTLATALGCAGGAVDIPEPLATVDATDPIGLPALEAGTHLGFILGFSPFEEGNRAAMLANERSLREAGLKIGRAQISWADLEPSPGVYDKDALDEVLAPHLEAGLAVALTLETIDSSSFEIPSDLLEEELVLAEGRAFDDPVILGRQRGLLTWLVPHLKATREGTAPGVYAIMVGNEPDNTISDQPDLGAPVAAFTAHARAVVRELDPELAVSMTLTLGAIEPSADWARQTVAGSDFLAINYYCHRSFDDWSPKDEAETRADLDAMRRLADGRPILIQELGCSPGFEGGALGVGEEAQAAWLEQTIRLLEEDPTTFRAAYWFTLTDWSPEVAALISQPLCDEGFEKLCRELDEAVQTYGLLRWSDGSPRPGFDVLKRAIRQ